MNGTMRFIGKLVFIVFLLLLLFSFAMFQGGFVSWFLFFSYLPIFLYHLGLLLYPIKKWEVTRNLSRHVIRAGDSITVVVRVTREVPFPLYYCICEEVFPDTLKKVDNRKEKYYHLDQPDKLQVNRMIKKVVFPGFRKEMELPYRIEQVPRGEHQLQAVRIKTGDVFGFIKKEHVFHVADQLVAYPNESKLHISERVSSFEQGSVSSYTLNLKNTNVATGIREYMPGDKFSWIDWKQTAKKNNVMTKEFEQEKSTDTILILDCCYYVGINPLAFEAAIEVTISLMEAIQKQASQVGLLSVGEETVYYPLHHDPTKKERMRQHLTRVQPGGNRPFALKLKEEVRKLSSGNIIMMITTNMDGAIKESLQQMKQRSKSVIVLFIQAKALISQQEHTIIQQLQMDGVIVNILSEQQLVQNTIEVNVR
ncbi:DUF58 domain-containing protein [Virgibacillus oceani]|uniref:DUF58 domain-containing protein n=1 Tax=Virgibacillus oceani TaxID=1479511 RepID=A0A917M1W8_9BACI|nr:DUF58 domain-containing protein [Virgibacillus oceani]GGG73994.1 hypothetical protein GCM10011398_18190 [Virgibacillus oceani]